MPYAIFYCPYCGKSERSSSDLVQYDGDQIKRCCGSPSCRQKEQEIGDKERKKREIDEELEKLRRQKQQAEKETKRKLREAELEHNPEVHEAEAKTGKSCWARSDSNIPIKGTCEKCKSSNQVIFEPRLKKVNPIGQEVFTNHLCADCYCQEEGISNPSPTNNKSPNKPSPSGNQPNSPSPTNDFKFSFTNTPANRIPDNSSGETCLLCHKTLTEVEKSHCYFPEQPQHKFCNNPCWQQAYCHSLVLEAIEKGENINVDYFSNLTPHSKAFLKALQQVKRGEDINVSDAVLFWEEKEQLPRGKLPKITFY